MVEIISIQPSPRFLLCIPRIYCYTFTSEILVVQ